jgi:hypothetical protein
MHAQIRETVMTPTKLMRKQAGSTTVATPTMRFTVKTITHVALIATPPLIIIIRVGHGPAPALGAHADTQGL